MNKGLLVNPEDNSSFFELKQLDAKDYVVVRDMKIGETSNPYETINESGKPMYKIVRLKSKTDPHKANMKQDYSLLQDMALADKKFKVVENWIREKHDETYIHIDGSMHLCDFLKKGGWLEANK
jgi:peptidyl-prolyl cis-trans isomerase SurA